MIPNFKRDIHYIWVGAPIPTEVTLLQYLSVISTLMYCNPNSITVWVSEGTTFYGKYYDSIKDRVNIVHFERMSEFLGNKLLHIQHDLRLESDIYRHLILHDHGGIYCDFDILWCKNIDTLLDSIDTEFAIGEQGINGVEGCNIGLLIGAPSNEYCKEFLSSFSNYDEEHQKNHTSIYTSRLPYQIAKKLQSKVTILPYNIFHWPLYHSKSVEWFYFSNPDDSDVLVDPMSGLRSSDKLEHNYAHHCFGHHGLKEYITEEYILNSNTPFTNKARSVLLYGKNNILHTK